MFFYSELMLLFKNVVFLLKLLRMRIKKILVFGATGGTGKEVVRQLLAGNYEVTAIVRNPDALEIQDSNLKVVKGDVLQPSAFEASVYGQDAVVSCLGARNTAPTTIYSDGISHITALMHRYGIRRLVCLSAVAVIIPPKGSWLLKFVSRYLLQKILKHAYADMLKMERIVSASDLDWTILRPPWLRDGPHTGKYRFSVHEYINRPYKISRADLADFIVIHLEDKTTYKAFVEVSY